MQPLRTGARFSVDSRDLCFSKYRTSAPLPVRPASFGHESLIADWGMLGNDTAGNCVVAGACHETMLWTAEGGTPAQFSTATALADYAAISGYDPLTGANDNGCDVREALKYRQQIGIADVTGKRHKIGAYLALDLGNIDHILEAVYLFSAVGCGFNLPADADQAFEDGKPWTLNPIPWLRPRIVGGHYVPLISSRMFLNGVTWGALQQIQVAWFRQYAAQAWAIVSEEFLTNGKSPEGFDLAALKADLAAL